MNRFIRSVTTDDICPKPLGLLRAEAVDVDVTEFFFTWIPSITTKSGVEINSTARLCVFFLNRNPYGSDHFLSCFIGFRLIK